MTLNRLSLVITLVLGLTSLESAHALSDNNTLKAKKQPHSAHKTVKKKATKSTQQAVPLAAFFTGSVAASSIVKDKLERIQSLADKQPNEAQKLSETFAGNPLEGYAQYLWLRPNIANKQFNPAISQYLTQFADTGWAETLRQEWSDALAKQQDWQSLLQAQDQLSKGNARCWVLEAMQQQNFVADTWTSEVTTLWQTDTNPSNGCKVVYDRLETSQQLNTAQWQAKLEQLYSQQKTDVISTKLSVLPQDLQAETQETLALIANPSIAPISDLLQQTNHSDAQAQKFVRSLASKIKSDAQAVLPIWQEGKSVFALNPMIVLPFEKQLYRQLAKKQPERAKEWLSKIDPSQQDEATLLPLIQQAWRESDWTSLRTYLDWLPASEQQADIWQYWRGRSLEALGFETEAKDTYRQLATHRSFYAFMAADKLGLDYQLNAQQVTGEQLEKARQSELGKRLQALYEAGLKDVAWKEWHYARNSGKLALTDMPGYAQAALGWGWNTFSALSLSNPAHWNYVDLRFTTPFQSLVKDKAERHAVPIYWAYGIMRRESVYSTDAKSKSGAMGLMQLMPKTAKALEPIKNINDVYQPELNVHLGTKLLGQLKREFSDNLVLASAAYNAGGFRVRQWLKQIPDLPSDQWIELIPYKETRDYVKAVMEYMLVFERLSPNTQPTRLSTYLGKEPAKVAVVENKCNPDYDWCL
jgi:soluble lytic murein transglycosylase